MAREKPRINNAFYEELEARWYEETRHPIALLRAENRLRNPWIAQVVAQTLPGDCRILDVGCGGGFLTNFLASLGHRVAGVDLSEKSLDVARQYDGTRSVEYHLGNATRLPFEEQQFDVVCAMDLLEHVENPAAVIQDCSRVLKRGGLFFFHTFSRTFLSWLFVIKGVEWMVPEAPENMHVYSLFLNPSELEAFCKRYQMEVKELLGVAPEFFSRGFWKMLFLKKIDTDFRFRFIPSLQMGYSGYALKS